MKKAFLTFVLFLASLSVYPVQAAENSPSFDCRRASSLDEKAICHNDLLAKMDVLMAAAYKIFQPEHQAKHAVGIEVLQDRRGCGSDEICILAVQQNALQAYGLQPPFWATSALSTGLQRKATVVASQRLGEPGAMPVKISDCAVTRISELSSRFGEPLTSPDSNGTVVTFVNGGHQVSYDKEYALVKSKVGDQAVLCLMSKPRDCPPNDERGRIYYGLNLRTNQSWQLPDAQHMCGGA